MFKISEFSRLTRVPAKTLRFYDDIGLFKPQHVDSWTGYRYYSATQLPRLHRIMVLKSLGFSLDQIKAMLDESLSVDEMRAMLRMKRAEIERIVDAERQRLADVESRLQWIEREDSVLSTYEVILKSIPAIPVASMREIVPDMEALPPAIERMFGELMGYVAAHGAHLADISEPGGMGIVVYHDQDFNCENLDIEVASPIRGSLVAPPDGHIHVHALPAVETMACTIHKGSFGGLGEAYAAMTRWVEANGYAIAGANREITLAYDPDGSPDDYVTELQFPVVKKN